MNQSNHRKRSVRRERILELLRGTKEHPTAEWVYEKLKKEYTDVSLGTVYRNLRILVEDGLAQSLQGGKSLDHFDADTSPHHHITCLQCGRVTDAPVTVNEEVFKMIEQITGYQVLLPQISVSGICPDCQRQNEKKSM